MSASLPGIPKPLCRVDEIPDPGARGFEIEKHDGVLDLVLVRKGRDVRGFVNCCPHMGTPLETFTDRFLTSDGAELLCSTHGARFRTSDGLCVWGPCKGKSLRRLETQIIRGFVYLNGPV